MTKTIIIMTADGQMSLLSDEMTSLEGTDIVISAENPDGLQADPSDLALSLDLGGMANVAMMIGLMLIREDLDADAPLVAEDHPLDGIFDIHPEDPFGRVLEYELPTDFDEMRILRHIKPEKPWLKWQGHPTSARSAPRAHRIKMGKPLRK